VADAIPSTTATAAMDELKRADRFATANVPSPTSGATATGTPLAAAEPQDAAAVPTNEALGAGAGALGGRNFKGGPAIPSQSTTAAVSPQSPSLIASGPAVPTDGLQLESDESQNPLVVVHVVAKQDAIENKSFDKMLKSKGINVEPEPSQEASGRAGGVATRGGNRPATESESLAERKSPAPPDENADIVLVEAPKSTIVAFLSELKDDVTNYSSIAVDEPPSGQDRSAVNGNLKKEMATDLGVFNRGVVTEKLKDETTSLYFNDAGRGSAQQAAPRGGVASDQNIRLEQAKQAQRNSIDASSSGRARRLSSFEMNRSGVEKSVERGRVPGFADGKKSTLRRSISGGLSPAGGESDNLQVLFVVRPEQAAASSAPAAKPAE
jgi:hypothetical protein